MAAYKRAKTVTGLTVVVNVVQTHDCLVDVNGRHGERLVLDERHVDLYLRLSIVILEVVRLL